MKKMATKLMMILVMAVMVMSGCMHIRHGDSEYWRFGDLSVADLLIETPDGTHVEAKTTEATGSAELFQGVVGATYRAGVEAGKAAVTP